MPKAARQDATPEEIPADAPEQWNSTILAARKTN